MRTILSLSIALAAGVLISGCAQPGVPVTNAHLEAFRTYELTTFSKHQWEDIGKTHAADVVVRWPEGRETKGLQAFIDGLKEMCEFAPDTRVSQQLTTLGANDWTSVMSVMEGTFTAPMPALPGEFLAPTGRRFSLVINTVARWNEKGLIDRQYLFWDNASYAQQLGIEGPIPSSSEPVSTPK